MLPLVKGVLSARHGIPDPGRRQDVLHPSEMCKKDWCHRASYFRLEGKAPSSAGNFSMTLQNVFAEGHAIHAKWQNWMAKSGQLWGDWHCPVCLATVRRTAVPSEMLATCFKMRAHLWEYQEVTLWDDELNIYGHEDGALIDARCLVEIKSVGIGTLRFEAPDYLGRYYHRELRQYDLEGLWRDLHRPLDGHVRQVNIYMWLAHRMGLPFEKTAMVYEFKANQQVKEFLVQFDPAIVSPILDKAAQVREARLAGEPPDCPNGGSCKECGPYEEAPVAESREPDRPADPVHRPAPGAVRGSGWSVHRTGRDEAGETEGGNGPDLPAVETDTGSD